MSAKLDYLVWRRRVVVGCVFARLIARRPGDYGQSVEEVAGTVPSKLGAKIVERIDRLVADSDVVAAALVLPGVSTLESLVRVALELRQHPRWRVTFTPLPNSRAGRLMACHIVRDLPLGDGACPSEALVFGPFSEFPPTRRAPVVAIEVYVGKPMARDPKTGQPTTRANLAHIDLPQLTQSAIDTMWARSEKDRLKSLGGEDDRAKARVSFVIPMSLASRLGCAQ